MTATTLTHKPSTAATALPTALVQYLDGSKLNAHVGEASYVTTIDEDGWPHASLLSVGEVLAVDAQHLNLAVWARSSTAKNMTRNGKLSMSLVHDGALLEVILEAKPAAGPAQGAGLALFTAKVAKVRTHRVDYADVRSNVTYSLHDQTAVIARWERQIADLRAVKAA